ncbi:MAG: SCO family protein [Magnetospirillum sp.]|nr:SCO family protein [Magnetospirillum sp.]
MTSRNTPLVAIFALILVLTLGVGLRYLVWDSHHPGGGATIGGPFTLVDGDGRTVTDSDFRGRFMLVYFGYTFCPDVCPTTLGIIASALDKLTPEQRQRIAPLFITVDPERDTPKVVKDYAASFYPGMIGLTGTPEQVTAAEKAYKVYAAKARPTSDGIYTVDHSSIIYLMGTDGRFLAHFAHGATADQIADGLRKVLN